MAARDAVQHLLELLHFLACLLPHRGGNHNPRLRFPLLRQHNRSPRHDSGGISHCETKDERPKEGADANLNSVEGRHGRCGGARVDYAFPPAILSLVRSTSAYNIYCNCSSNTAILLTVNDLPPPDPLDEVLTLVVTVEEIRITLGPSEEHWRKASFMSWKELPESFEAAFGDEDIAAANSLRLRDMVRQMAQNRCRLQKFEEPYTDYMVGETGIGKKVRRTVTVSIRFQGDPPLSGPLNLSTTIERGVTRKQASQEKVAAPGRLSLLRNFIRRSA
jgi:hypothetical protein